MEIKIIAFIGDDIELINMFNYIFYKGITKSKFTDYIMMNNDLPIFMKQLIINVDDIRTKLFTDLFEIKDYELKRKEWYDFKTHKFLKPEEITIENSRVYSSELFNITDINERLGFPIDYPIVKVDELKNIYLSTIEKLFGDVMFYNVCRKAYDIAFANERCFMYSIKTVQEAITFKQTFSSTGDIVDLTGCSNIPCDYKADGNLLKTGSPLIRFHHILNIVKFILI